MGVRPPQDDGGDEPETISFGIAALDARLDGAELEYPVGADEVVDRLGDPKIPYDAAGSTVRLSEVMEKVHFQRFEDEQELLNALHPVFESYREKASGSILGQLRALLPF